MNRHVLRLGTAFAVSPLLLACGSGDTPDPTEQISESSDALSSVAGACVEQSLQRVAALASSTENAGTPAASAIDGIVGTRWSSQASDPQWLRIDLGIRKRVTRVRLDWEGASARDYRVEVSDDGTNFTPIASRTGLASQNHRIDDLTGLNGAGRYVRVYSTARSTGWGVSLWEAQIFGDPDPVCTPSGGATCTDGVKNGTETGVDCGGSCPACLTACTSNALPRSSATATSQQNASLAPAMAIDASAGTRWSSLSSDPQSITVDLGTARYISRVVLSWEAAASARYSLEVASAASGPWTTIYGPVTGNGGTDDITATGTGRFVRMSSTARTTQYGNSLWDFAIYGDLNPSCSGTGPVDTDGDRLSDSDEQTRGTNPNNPDSDGDGLPDGDEVLGTTGGLNLPALGANPRHKNVLLEYDWFDDSVGCGAHSHRPTPAAIQRLTQAFANSPISNLDGIPGIVAISDYGQGGAFTGGNRVADADGIVDSFGPEYVGYKAANFAANRAGYFHYVIMPHQYDNPSNFSSGLAYYNDDDMIVSLACSTWDEAVANTIMHELGHNMGLLHGGNTATNWKPNYASVMNYKYQFPGADTNCDGYGDGVLDYSRGTRAPLDENSLDEVAGICGGVGKDWSGNGFVEAGRVRADINVDDWYVGDGAYEVLQDHNDWAALFYDFAPAGGTLRAAQPQLAVCNNPIPPRP